MLVCVKMELQRYLCAQHKRVRNSKIKFTESYFEVGLDDVSVSVHSLFEGFEARDTNLVVGVFFSRLLIEQPFVGHLM